MFNMVQIIFFIWWRYLIIYLQDLSFDEVKFIEALRNGDGEFLLKRLSSRGFDDEIIASTCRTIIKEMQLYCSSADALLSRSTAIGLLNFSLPALEKDLRSKVPTLMDLISTIIQRNDISSRKETVAATIVAKILGSYNQTLSSFRYVIGLILETGGAKDSCMNRLAISKDCVTPQVLRKKVNEMAELIPILVKDWDKPRSNSTIVFDNVNPYVKPRHQTTDKGNKLYSMTHGLMMKDRVPTDHLSDIPSKTIQELTLDDCLPSVAQTQQIQDCFVRVIRNVWADNIPSMEWMRENIPAHKHTQYTSKQTEYVRWLTNLDNNHMS